MAAVPVDSVTPADVDALRYDDLSFSTKHGPVGVTVFMPSVLQATEDGPCEVLVPYSAGWGEGRGAAENACQALARAGRTMAAVIDYPDVRLRVHDIVPFRTEILSAAVRFLRQESPYDDLDIVVAGYSRGTVPARHAALEQADLVRGLSLVAPTWFAGPTEPFELARKGLAEGARGMLGSGWLDKWDLLTASARLVQEFVTHPIALRNDVAAIAQEGVTDLREVIDAGVAVGVVAGSRDEICPMAGIRSVVALLADEPLDFREVESDHFCYFLKPAPVAQISRQIRVLAGRPDAGESPPST